MKVRIRWTGCGRAGAAEIAWEEARDGGARCGGRRGGLWTAGAAEIAWTGGGRAGAAEIAWEEGSRRGKPVKSRVANFSKKKKGTLLLRFSGCGNGM